MLIFGNAMGFYAISADNLNFIEIVKNCLKLLKIIVYQQMFFPLFNK